MISIEYIYFLFHLMLLCFHIQRKVVCFHLNCNSSWWRISIFEKKKHIFPLPANSFNLKQKICPRASFPLECKNRIFYMYFSIFFLFLNVFFNFCFFFLLFYSMLSWTLYTFLLFYFLLTFNSRQMWFQVVFRKLQIRAKDTNLDL